VSHGRAQGPKGPEGAFALFRDDFPDAGPPPGNPI